MMMLPDNPFFYACSQLIDYLLPRSGALRSKLVQATNGEQAVNILLYPSEPPSPFGYMEINLSFDCGEMSNLELARDFGEGVWLPEDGPIMISDKRYTPAMGVNLDYQEQLERIEEALSLQASPSASIFADQWIDSVSRTAWVGGEIVEAQRIEVGFADHYRLIEIHSTDWRAEGQRILEQLATLCEAATGERPMVMEREF